MPENFDFLQDNKYEVGNVRNFLLSARLNAERKPWKTSLHVIYAIVCALVMYVAMSSYSVLSVVARFVCPAMCVYPLLYSPPILKAISLFLGPVFYVASAAITGSVSFYSMAGNLFTCCLCLLCAVIFTKAVISGYTKNTVFVLITACYTLIFALQIVFIVISVQGAFSFELLKKTATDLYSSSVNSIMDFAATDEGFAYYSVLFEGMGQEVTKELVLSQLKTAFSATSDLLRSLIPFVPSFFIVLSMIYSFLTVAVFSIFANRQKLDVFVCIMDDKWTYRPSMLSVKLYDVVFFAFILCMFINLPQNISATIINVFTILTPLMFVSGIRCIYSYGVKKTGKKFAVAAIIGIVLFVLSSITAGLTAFIASSVGISFIIARDREEKAVLPNKLKEDISKFNAEKVGK